jgi:FAD/FMN-containing dehydrogenase
MHGSMQADEPEITNGQDALMHTPSSLSCAAELLLPGSPEYERLRVPAMARFAAVRPAAIARCRTPADVAAALALARRRGLPVTARAGGHCFEGGSSTRGLLIDVGPMDGLSLAGESVTVCAGMTLGRLYDALATHGRTLAAGCGPTVGVAGLALGGGLGILGRRFGLTSDQLLGAELVLADGRVVWCDEGHYGDLFWALRGAGGCRFGVLTRLALKTVPAPGATSFELRWPPRAATAVLQAWQQWAPGAPDEWAASLLITAPADVARPVAVQVFGAAVDVAESDTRAVLDGLVARAGVPPDTTTVAQLPYRETKRRLAEPGPEAPAAPDPGHRFAKSEFFRRSLPPALIADLVEHLTARRTPGCSRELDFTPWGGAYNRIRPEATAFVHRAERFLLKHEVVVAAERAEALTAGARAWLARSWELGHRAGAGGAYPNFPDRDLDAWHPAYHGANLDRLLRVKARYDPDTVFGDDAAGAATPAHVALSARTPPPPRRPR